MTAPDRRFPRWMWWLLAAIVLVCGFPAFAILAASGIVALAGCTESIMSSPCMIMGSDWAPTLLNISLLGWFGALTLPAGAVALTVWLVAAVVFWSRGRKAAGLT